MPAPQSGDDSGAAGNTDTSSIGPLAQNTRAKRQQITCTDSSNTYNGDVDAENEIADEIPEAEGNEPVQYHNDECSICDRADNEDTMVLCDHCHRAYHTSCTLSLTSIPNGDWKCPACTMYEEYITAQRQKKETFVSYPTPGEWKGEPPNRHLETYNLYKVTNIIRKANGPHVHYIYAP